MKTKYYNSYEVPLREWIFAQEESRIASLIAARVATRLPKFGYAPDVNPTQEQIDELDEKRYDLEESGEKEKSYTVFEEARLLAAKLALDEGSVDDALLDYTSSIDYEFSKEVIADLELGETS